MMPVSPGEPPADLVDRLVAEHRTVEGLFADIETTADRQLRREALDAVIAALKRHSATEERYLYPATREHLPAGEDIAGHQLRDHAEAAERMDRITRLDETDPEFEPLIATFMTDIRDHVQEEETEIFPRLRAACDPETLRQLGNDAGGLSGR
jgi:hemerythrin superfamily protein